MSSVQAFSHRYGMAVASTALALLVTWLLRPLPSPLPSLPFLVAVIGSTVYGGLGPGLLATGGIVTGPARVSPSTDLCATHAAYARYALGRLWCGGVYL